MQNKIKVLHDFKVIEESRIKAKLKIPKDWWSSNSTFGIQEKQVRSDPIHLTPGRFAGPDIPRSEYWNIIEGDYLADSDEKNVNTKTFHELQVRRERLYLLIGLVTVCIVVTLFSFLVAKI